MNFNWRDLGVTTNGRMGGQIKTQCPKCSSDRTKKSERCLSVNLDDGVFQCHHCEWNGKAESFGQFRSGNWEKPRKVYRKPTYTPQSEPADKLLEWFAARHIPAEVVRRNKIERREVYFPATQSNQPAIAFPYFRDGQVINVQYRSAGKDFVMEKDAEPCLYGLDDIEDNEELYIVEGQCFPGEVEVLTREGWIRFDLYKGQDVAQVDGELRSTFVKPTQVIRKPFIGSLLQYEKGGNYTSITTPDHNLVYKQKGAIGKRRADEMPSNLYGGVIPTTVEMDGEGIALSDDQIALCIAISADGSIRNEKQGYTGRYVVFGFKRQRKIDRMRTLLARLEIKASDTSTSGGYTTICFHLPEWATERMLPVDWLSNASLEQRKFILQEMVYWDGNFVKGRAQTEYSSKHLHNAVWMQTMAHTAGMMSTVMLRQKEFGDVYKVSVLHHKRSISWQNMKKTTVPFEGDVYCVTVPTGMILVRQKGRISVSGNCDKLAMEAAGMLNCVSVPNGAGSNLDCFAADEARLAHVKRFFIAVDNDEKGKKLEADLVSRLGRDKCWLVEWPKGCKDANDVLIAHGIEGLCDAALSARPIPIDGAFEINDLREEIFSLYDDGLPEGFSPGWVNLGEHYRPALGQWTAVVAIPGSGKTAWLAALMVNMAISHDWKFCVFPAENLPAAQYASLLAEIFLGMPFNRGVHERMTREELDTAIDWLHDHFIILNPSDDELDLDSLLSMAKAYCLRRGIKGFVIDPWNELDHKQPPHQSETQYIAHSLIKVRRFAKTHNIHLWIVVHPTKMAKDRDGNYPVPTLYDASGSAHWRNKADFGIALYRHLDDDQKPVEVHVQKVRWKWCGKIGLVKLYFDKLTGRYSEKSPYGEYMENENG